MISIRVTKAEASMESGPLMALEYMTDEYFEEFGYTAQDIPYVEGGALIFPTESANAAADMLYRITEQINDMADQEGRDKGRRPSTVAAAQLAEKIRPLAELKMNPLRSTFLRFKGNR